MKFLVTGGAGYIGSHISLVLLQHGHEVVILDNLINASRKASHRVEGITGKSLYFVEGDIRDKKKLKQVFDKHKISAVIHLAGLKAVGESITIPLEYYETNVYGTNCLLAAMADHDVKRIIFSSSATVYGPDNDIPYVETMQPSMPTSPYGATKLMAERIITDVAVSDSDFQSVILRYFNPIGAHNNGKIGEAPNGVPNNLMPFIAQVAIGKRDSLSVFGDRYHTKDGSCERDYLHVMDLADGHLAALNWIISNTGFRGVEVFNLGTGNAISVFSIIKAFENATGIAIPYHISPKRDGDLPTFWANADKAIQLMGWKATRSLNQMMRDTWRWQKNNPDGY